MTGSYPASVTLRPPSTPPTASPSAAKHVPAHLPPARPPAQPLDRAIAHATRPLTLQACYLRGCPGSRRGHDELRRAHAAQSARDASHLRGGRYGGSMMPRVRTGVLAPPLLKRRAARSGFELRRCAGVVGSGWWWW